MHLSACIVAIILKYQKEIPFENEIPATSWLLQPLIKDLDGTLLIILVYIPLPRYIEVDTIVCSGGGAHKVCVYSPLLTQSLLYITCT